jgi:hypothetical protein
VELCDIWTGAIIGSMSRNGRFSAKQTRVVGLLAHLFHPVALHAVLRHVIPCDHAGDLMVGIHHHQVAQTHSAEEAIAPLHAAALIYAVRRAVHVRADVQP